MGNWRIKIEIIEMFVVIGFIVIELWWQFSSNFIMYIEV